MQDYFLIISCATTQELTSSVQINKMDEAIKAMKYDPAKVVGKQAVAPTPKKEEKK